MKLKEKVLSWTGNDYVITTPDDQELFRIKGKVMSMRSKKTLFDNQGQPILSIADKVWTILRAFDIYAGESIDKSIQPVAHVEGHFSLTKNKLTATLNNTAGDGRPVTLEIVGSFLDRKCEITCDGKSVARVHRKWWNLNEELFDMATYYLTVGPGVDAALLAAIVVCLNEKTDGKA